MGKNLKQQMWSEHKFLKKNYNIWNGLQQMGTYTANFRQLKQFVSAKRTERQINGIDYKYFERVPEYLRTQDPRSKIVL